MGYRGDGEVDIKNGAFADFAFHRDCSMMRVHDIFDDFCPEAGPPFFSADGGGGEETVPDFRRHPSPGILDGDVEASILFLQISPNGN